MTDCGTDCDHRRLPLVAKRLAGWTSNLLVLGIVLVIGLTFGRELTSWWALDSLQPPQAGLGAGGLFGRDPSHSERNLHYLTFGDLPIRLGRQTVTGPKAAVFAALRAQCRGEAERRLRVAREPGPAERKMLQGTAGMTPVEQTQGKWRMYQMDGPFPLVVVTDWRNGDAEVAGGLAPAQVLLWGLGLPVAAGTAEWTLVTCAPTARGSASAADPLALPMPPGARRQTSLRNEDGGGILLLAGSGDPEKWLSSFDAWFREHGWSAAEGWSTVRGARHRRYAHPAEGFAADIVVEVPGELRVMLTVTRQ